MNRVLHGISASPGIVVGPVRLLRWEVPEVPHRIIDDDHIDEEIVRFKAASKFRSEVTIRRDDMEVNGKSIMGVMMLAAEYGTTLWLRANGDDAEQAVEAIATLVASRFGERDA